MDRRDFLKGAASTALTLGILGSASAETEQFRTERERKMAMKKAILFSMLPESLDLDGKLKTARDAGFEAVEMPPISDPAQIKSTRTAADKAGIHIHSIIYGGWQAPLSSPDPKIAEQGTAGLTSAIKCAGELGADGVLLVPAMVDGVTRYTEAYERSQKHIRPLIPLAEKLQVRILIENVWNNFLLSPIEFARYIDEFRSPWVQAYFDVGNVAAFGWSEDWIRTLGRRIRKIHLKDFKRGPRQFCNLLDGDINWHEVHKALSEVGYNGYLTPELGGGDEAYLKDISSRVDKILAG